MDVTLIRAANSDQGILGKVYLDDTFFCYSLELPWLNNQPNKSCIPSGNYPCTWGKSPAFGWCYTVANVPDRSFIRIHHGNVAGDVSKGFKSDSRGCPLLGNYFGQLWGQKAVLSSRIARSDFEIALNEEPFILHIIGGSE